MSTPLAVVSLWGLACTTTPSPLGPSLPPAQHAGEWAALVRAADRGEVQTVQVLARDLTLAPVPDDHPAAASLGGALGYLQIATDPEDFPDAIARARRACRSCHDAKGVVVELP